MNDERRLLRALARRDRGAWATIYDRHVPDLFGFVYHLVGGDRALAEDIHQEVWLAALEGIDRYDHRTGRFRDWLMGIARHRVSRHFRGTSPAGSGSIFDWGVVLGTSGLPPPDQLESLERADVIRAALLRLNPVHREVLLKKYVEDSSVREIARCSGRSVKAVESLLSRAREQLRDLLRPYFSQSNQGIRYEPADPK
ncbi:MAG: RNA polymerase sigma factor [Isosphaeraceae bacterium]